MPALHKARLNAVPMPLRGAVLVLCLVAGPAVGQQVYKCGAVYSDKPCGHPAEVVELKTYSPSAKERALARERAAADRRDVQISDREFAQRAARAQAYANQNAARDAAHDYRCASIQQRARNAANERELYFTQGYKNDADRRRKEAEDQHFSECYGVR